MALNKKEGRIRKAIRKKFLNVQEMRFWKMLPRKILHTPGLEVLKV